MFIFETERESKQWRGRERATEDLKRALHWQQGARRGAWTHEPWDRDLSLSWTLNRPSHPGSPLITVFKITYCFCLLDVIPPFHILTILNVLVLKSSFYRANSVSQSSLSSISCFSFIVLVFFRGLVMGGVPPGCSTPPHTTCASGHFSFTAVIVIFCHTILPSLQEWLCTYLMICIFSIISMYWSKKGRFQCECTPPFWNKVHQRFGGVFSS